MINGNVQANNVNFYGGISLNQLKLEEVNNITDNYGSEKIEFGVGFFGGVDYRIYDNVFIGSELDYIESNWETILGSIKGNSIGALGTLAYKFPIEMMNLKFKSGLGLYFSKIESNLNEIENGQNNGFGYKLGMDGDIKLNENTNINIRGMYRGNNVEVSNVNLDYSGFEFNTGITYKF